MRTLLTLLALGTATVAGAADLLDPSQATETAPEQYVVVLDTTAGDVHVKVVREWAPIGADRFYNLVRMGYYDGAAFFRVLPRFMAQVGLHGEPSVNAVWQDAKIEDDPVLRKNTAGAVSFAMAGPGTRTTQIFINTASNKRLDEQGFAPFGKVTKGKGVVKALYGLYGDGPPNGYGPSQERIRKDGLGYLKANFPRLDYIESARIEE